MESSMKETKRRAVHLVHHEDMGDWYSIEWTEHENRTELRNNPGGWVDAYFSGRVSDASVEGTAQEMLGIAAGIEKGDGDSFKRCAVRIEGDAAYFCSPRNSQQEGAVHIDDARALAAQIRAQLAHKPATDPQH